VAEPLPFRAAGLSPHGNHNSFCHVCKIAYMVGLVSRCRYWTAMNVTGFGASACAPLAETKAGFQPVSPAAGRGLD